VIGITIWRAFKVLQSVENALRERRVVRKKFNTPNKSSIIFGKASRASTK
jgi:hypothetical protein